MAAAAAVAAVGTAFGLTAGAEKTDASPPAVPGGHFNYGFVYKTHGLEIRGARLWGVCMALSIIIER
jgi:hypothetical protein